MPKLFETKSKTEPEYFLKLKSLMPNEVTLIIVNEYGNDVPAGKVITINRDGELRRHPSIDKDAARKAGIETESSGRIVQPREY